MKLSDAQELANHYKDLNNYKFLLANILNNHVIYLDRQIKEMTFQKKLAQQQVDILFPDIKNFNATVPPEQEE